jgi:hypothetical protein
MWVSEARAARYVRAIGHGHIERVHVGEASRQYASQERHPDGMRGSQYRCLDAMRRKLATGEQGRELRRRALAKRVGWVLRWNPGEGTWEAVWRLGRYDPMRSGQQQVTRSLRTQDPSNARAYLSMMAPPRIAGEDQLGRVIFFVDGWDDVT